MIIDSEVEVELRRLRQVNAQLTIRCDQQAQALANLASDLDGLRYRVRSLEVA